MKHLSRRDLLIQAGRGFGSVALASMLQADSRNPLAPKAPHQAAKAKSVIHLFMHGGVSHVDTFDPKPELAKRSGETHLGGSGEGPEDQSHRFQQGAHARQSLEVYPPAASPAWRFPSCSRTSDRRLTRSR